MQNDDEDDEDGDAPKRGQKRLKRSKFVDDIAAVDEEEDDEEEEVHAIPQTRTPYCEGSAMPSASSCSCMHPGRHCCRSPGRA